LWTDGWISQDITSEDRARALDLANTRRAEARRIGFSPRFQSDPLRNEVNGILGEIKFGEYLGVPEHHIVGSPDAYDFKINGEVYDVKTNEIKIHPNNFPPGYRFLINRAQVDTHRGVDYYVSVMIHNAYSWICGYLPRVRVLNYPLINYGYGESYRVPFEDLVKFEVRP
jgi:hypothetical protein